MNAILLQLDGYASRNTETALRILRSGQSGYTFANLTEEPRSSQDLKQPVTHGYSLYSSYSNSLLPLSNIPAPEGNTLPYDIDKFPPQSYTYGGAYTQIAVDRADIFGQVPAQAPSDILSDLEDRQQGFQLNHMQSYGITSHPPTIYDQWVGTEGYDLGTIAQSTEMEAQMMYRSEEPKIRGRGRPRIYPKDEATAERRKTQIRLAQRAYRQRQDTTISSLERKAQGLLEVKKEMGNIIDSLYANAVCIGLLQREPEFSQLLQSTAEKFSTLSKIPGDDTVKDRTKADEAEDC